MEVVEKNLPALNTVDKDYVKKIKIKIIL